MTRYKVWLRFGFDSLGLTTGPFTWVSYPDETDPISDPGGRFETEEGQEFAGYNVQRMVPDVDPT